MNNKKCNLSLITIAIFILTDLLVLNKFYFFKDKPAKNHYDRFTTVPNWIPSNTEIFALIN